MYALFFAAGDKYDRPTFIAFAFVNCWLVWLIGDDARGTTSPHNIYSFKRYLIKLALNATIQFVITFVFVFHRFEMKIKLSTHFPW